MNHVVERRTTTWLYRITRNVLIDLERFRGRDHELRDRFRLETMDLLKHMKVALSPQQRAALDLVDLQWLGFGIARCT